MKVALVRCHHPPQHSEGSLEARNIPTEESLPGLPDKMPLQPAPHLMSDFADQYRSIVQSIVEGQVQEARKILRSIPGGERALSTVPRSVPITLQCHIFFRDRFVCRYCEKRTIRPPVLRLVSHFLGDDFRYHPHGRMTECHIAFWRDIASCDHILPVARGGNSS